MKSKNINAKIILFAVMSFLILNLFSNVNAVIGFPADGSGEEQQSWILNNPDNFSPDNNLQKQAFLQVYENKIIDLRDAAHKNLVEKYLTSYQNNIPFEERKILEDFIEYYTLDKIQIDLSKGRGISLKKEGNNLFLVSSDGMKHDIIGFNSLDISEKKLEKIQSRDDGTIELCFDALCDNSIHLKDNTIKKDFSGRFVLNDGTILELKNSFGNLDIDGNRFSCFAKTCSFAIGLMNTELNQNGVFEALGENRFSVIDGKIKLGENILSGSYEFSTNKLKTGIDFSKNINLRSFLRENEERLTDSFIQTNTENYGKVEIRTNSLFSDKTISNVIACFDCSDFVKHLGQYEGYIDLRKQTQGLFNAEIKGKLTTKFEDDAEHFGNDENLLLTFESNPNQAQFKLQSCEGCTEERVGSQVLNGKKFDIFSDEDGDEQRFNVLEDWFFSDEEGDYSRKIYLIDNPGEVKGTYLIDSDGTITIDKVTRQDIDDHKEYKILTGKRAEKGLNIFENLDEEEQKAFLSFFEEMSDGRDGEIIKIGKIRRDGTVAGKISYTGEQFYAIGNGEYVAIQDKNIIKLLDEGKISLSELAELGRANRDIGSFEAVKTIRTIVEAFSPQTPEEIAMNLVLGGAGRVERVGLAIKNAGTELRALRAAANTGEMGAVAMMAGGRTASKEIATISKLENAFSPYRVSKADDFAKIEGVTQQGREAFINDVQNKLAEKLKEARGDLSSDEFLVKGLRGQITEEGKELVTPRNLLGGNQDALFFLDRNERPLFMASIYSTKQEAEEAKNILIAMEKLGVGRGYRYKAGFKVDYQPGTGGEGYMVVRELPIDSLHVKPEVAFEQFQKQVENLEPEKARAAIEYYKKCCRLDVSGRTLEPVQLKSQTITSETTLNPTANLPEVRVERVGSSPTPKIKDAKTGEIVGEFGHSVEGNTLKIGYVNVLPGKRGYGYNTAALNQILKENPGITRIETRLTQTNQEEFTKALIQKISPNTKISSNTPLNVQFGDCCADKILSKSREEVDALVKEALRETPAYKTRVKSGFRDICGQNLKIQKTNPANPSDVSVFIDFATCR